MEEMNKELENSEVKEETAPVTEEKAEEAKEEPKTEEKKEENVDTEKVMGVLAYLSWLVLIPLIAGIKDSETVKFHTNQGLILAIIEIVAGTVFGILSIIPVVGIVFGILGWLVGLASLIFSILGIINVVQDKKEELPYIGKYKILK